MKKHNTSQTGIFNLRVVLAIALCTIGGSFGWFSFAGTPSSGTLSPSAPLLTYDAGPFPIANQSPLGAGQLDDGPRCDTEFPCDSYTLTLDVPGGYITAHPNASIKVSLYWTNTEPTNHAASDYDLYVYKGNVTTLNGTKPADGQGGGQDNPEIASLGQLVEGLSTYTIKVVPFQPAAETVHVRIEFLEGSGAPGFPGFGLADPTIPGNPRFQTFVGSANPGSGEFNIGFNPATGRIMTMNSGPIWRITPAERLVPAKPECCTELWENKSNQATNIGVDPILWTDQKTGRTFASNSTVGANAVYGFSDNDGDLWVPLAAAPLSGSTDHETIGSGPYPAALAGSVDAVNHGQAVYYCAQSWPLGPATCQRSDSLGSSYGPGIAPYLGNGLSACSGIHGHIKVGPDGTVYLPVRSCGAAAGLVVSTDGGITWTEHVIPNSDNHGQGSDPTVAIGADNTVYFFYVAGTPDGTQGHVHCQVSNDHGATWTNDRDLGVSHGIVNTVFPEAVAGDGDRAAVGFVGTDKPGYFAGLDFPGYWYLFVATTYDRGDTWQVVNATPNEPVQGKGGIWLGGGGNGNRNLLDFDEVTMDDKGRVLFGYSDGCIGGCVGNPENNSFSAAMRVARQIGGKGLLANKDTAEPAVPKAPCLSGSRNASGVHLTWKTPDNGGADIAQYAIYRGTASGNETLLLLTGTTKTIFDDITADPAQPVYYYVRAINSVNIAGGTNSQEVNFAATPGIQLLGITSVKTHGIAGDFGINLPLNGTGIECRSSGATNDYKLVFDFANAVSSVASATVSSGTGSISSAGVQGGNYVVFLTGVANAQTITVTLTGITDSAGNSLASLTAAMSVLLGDTTADRFVNSSDISQTKSQSGTSVSASNFREDLTVDGNINSTDIGFVKSKSGTALPSGNQSSAEAASASTQPATPRTSEAQPQRAHKHARFSSDSGTTR
jgi:hypothetical protein